MDGSSLVKYERKEAKTLDVHCCDEDFMSSFIRAARVYIEKPQVVNRRLCGSLQVSIEKLRLRPDTREILFENRSVLAEKSTPAQFRNEMWSIFLRSQVAHPLDDGECLHYENEMILQDLLPKNNGRFPIVRQLVVLDCSNSTLLVLPLWHYRRESIETSGIACHDLVYEIQMCTEIGNLCQLKLNVLVDPTMPATVSNEQWLCDVLLHKMAKWMEEPLPGKRNISSLQLLPVDTYNDLYQHMKEKYGKDLVKTWPERTDPQKFVFEDIAIAAYLLVLWGRERLDLHSEKKQSFADLGCGNGLLVYILGKEGHPGFGVDIRKRNIWDMYGEDTDLREAPIIPSNTHLLSDTDWLIGNHSDELTPWIPVMAARSSYKTRFFVLPCCHHDFDSKFSEKKAGESQYRTYLDFIKNVCEVCGFKVQEDALRIPSTKRICLIGKTRSYTPPEESKVDHRRAEYIKSRCKKMTENVSPKQLASPINRSVIHSTDDQADAQGAQDSNSVTTKMESQTVYSSHKAWADSFQPREKVEKVRNCSQVSRELTTKVVKIVFDAVLNAVDSVVISTKDGRSWTKGGVVPLSHIVSLLSSDILQKLKSECGGVQTLLRNHHSIFQVSGGAVRLRFEDPEKGSLQCGGPPHKKLKKNIKELQQKQKPVKTKLCWFNENHPNGCPNTREQCQFAHGPDDLVKSEPE